MGKSELRGRGNGPPISDYRHKTGRHQAKLGKPERTETHNKALARRQEFPWRKLVLAMISFSAFCGLLYMYLTYVLADDEEDEVLAKASSGKGSNATEEGSTDVGSKMMLQDEQT